MDAEGFQRGIQGRKGDGIAIGDRGGCMALLALQCLCKVQCLASGQLSRSYVNLLRRKMSSQTADGVLN